MGGNNLKDKFPEIFKTKVNKLKADVQNQFYYHKDKREPTVNASNEEIRTKISNIFLNNDYVYKADINIMLKNGESMFKKLIGFKKDYILTMDGDKININDIADIK